MDSNNLNIEKRPKLKLPYNNKEKIAMIIATLGMIFLIIYLAINWNKMPESIPTHFGIDGTVDSWGGKGSLIILPIISILLYTSLMILSLFPSIYNFPIDITKENANYQYYNARETMLYINSEIVICFGFINWKSVQVALGEADGMGIGFLPIFLSILFVTLGYKIFKMYKANKEI